MFCSKRAKHPFYYRFVCGVRSAHGFDELSDEPGNVGERERSKEWGKMEGKSSEELINNKERRDTRCRLGGNKK